MALKDKLTKKLEGVPAPDFIIIEDVDIAEAKRLCAPFAVPDFTAHPVEVKDKAKGKDVLGYFRGIPLKAE